jgi:peptidoglycan L-alanyl-D-glutamate endopeptidase CwlK
MERGAFKLSPESEKILSTVRPDLQRVIRHAASITTVPFAVVSGNRTAHQQRILYAKGRTTPGPKVTWTLNSNHMGGGAIDFSAVDSKGKPTNHQKHTWNASYYKPIAETILQAGRELGIPVEWPLWKKGDWGHIQLTKPYRPLTIPEMAPTAPQEVAEASRLSSGYNSSSDNLALPGAAIGFLEQYGWKRHQAVALVANGIWESGGKTYIKTNALGDGGTAHGGFQWRGDRYIGRNGLFAFAYKYYPGHSTVEPQVQLAYVDWELRHTERRAGNLLKEAETLEEAVKAAISYLRPVHFTWEEPEKGHGYARRLEIAKGLL